jgi:HSP20 family protein
MNLIRYSHKPLDLLSMDRWFDDVLESSFVGPRSASPAVDIKETTDSYHMEVELPGLSEKDVEVKLDNNLLTISSAKTDEGQEKANGYILRERRSLSFQRSFVLPEEVDREKILAAFKDGVLSLSFPKVPAAQPRTIEVKKA